jgi:hypothetical protein
MPFVGADPVRLRELAQALWDAAQELEDEVTATSDALVAAGFVAVPGDPAASRQFWLALNAIWMALEDAAVDLRARADALDADQEEARCADWVNQALGIFGLGFIVETIGAIAQGDNERAGDLYDGIGVAISVDTAFQAGAWAGFTATGSHAVGYAVADSALPLTAAATLGEIYCATPTAGPGASPINQQRGDDPEDWVFGENDIENNGAMAVNCTGPDCLAQLQGS